MFNRPTRNIAVAKQQTNAFWECAASSQAKRNIIDRVRNQIEARGAARVIQKPDILQNIMPYLLLYAEENP